MSTPDEFDKKKQRKAGAFNITNPAKSLEKEAQPRPPLAVSDPSLFEQDETDIFENLPEDELNTPFSEEELKLEKNKKISIANIFWGALGVLISFAIGIWTQDLIVALFDRSTWLGWIGLAAALIGFTAFFTLLAREFLAIRRLSSVIDLQLSAMEAFKNDNTELARASVARLIKITENIASTNQARQVLIDTKDDIIDGRNLIELAEREILSPLDKQARALILSSAKRVSVVTAISPRALVDIVFVIYESARLIRRIAELYGTRPGWLGFIKLSRRVLAHLAVTGTIAMGDSLIQQLVGQGLASRLSAKLGEGVINGLMTARIGLSALDVVRPYPFQSEKRPNISDIIVELTKIGKGKS